MSIATRRNGVAPDLLSLDEIDLGSWEFWTMPGDVRDAAFATLRAKAPISLQGSPQVPGYPAQDLEHWALTRHEDVWRVSRHPQVFSSWPSIVVGDTPEEVAELFGSMIVLDDPRHFRLRSIVQKAFTPRMITQVEEYVRARARALVEQMVQDHPDGTCDIVEALSGPLPLQVICDMMGIPDDDVAKIFRWTNVILGTGDPEIATDYAEFAQVAQDMAMYGMATGRRPAVAPQQRPHHQSRAGRARRRAPDGHRGGVVLHPPRRRWQRDNPQRDQPWHRGAHPLPGREGKWWADFDGHARTASEEIVRWASPVIYMRRRAIEDTEISGQPIAAGDKVTMWYNSANRDEKTFVDPWRFDVLRDPNPQVGFGVGRPALLPRRQPGAPRDHDGVLGAASPGARHRGDGGASHPAVELHPRDQAPARRLDACVAGQSTYSSPAETARDTGVTRSDAKAAYGCSTTSGGPAVFARDAGTNHSRYPLSSSIHSNWAIVCSSISTAKSQSPVGALVDVQRLVREPHARVVVQGSVGAGGVAEPANKDCVSVGSPVIAPHDGVASARRSGFASAAWTTARARS